MLELREKKIGRLVAMIIMEWIKKITDIIMPPGVEEEEEIKKAEIKKEEPPAQVTEKKIEEPKIEPEPLPEPAPAQSFQAEKQAIGIGGTKFARTHVTTSDGVASMNGMRYEAYSSEPSVRPSLAVVKTTQMTIKIYTPTKYDEQAKNIGQDLIQRNAVVVNYEGMDAATQQRIGDFILGVVYTISGHVEMITNKIMLYVPEGFEVSSAQAAIAATLRRYN